MKLRPLRSAVLAAAAALLLGATASPAHAASTITVCSSGCNRTTIAAAVALAAPGDTILVTEDLSVSAAVSVGKDVTITGADGVTITRTGTSASTFSITSVGDGTTISNLEITSSAIVAGAFIAVANGANDVTIEGNMTYGPPQTTPMGSWVVNRAWISGSGLRLTVRGNTIHSLRTGGYIDQTGTGVLADNVLWNTKGDFLLSGQTNFQITGDTVGGLTKPSEWSIVVFPGNNTPYDVAALAAANPCMSVWDQDTNETFVDGDCDGRENRVDNCPTRANADQADLDGDALGDICDPDDDGDTVGDEVDNCPVVANASQADTDGDGLGDACDPDDDGDAVLDGSDNCPLVANASQADLDGDGLGDACDPDDDGDAVVDAVDNCPVLANASQADAHGDGLGDPCDPDDDGDGIDDTPPPSSADACKKGGWATFNNPSFENQGQCVSYLATRK